MSGHSKWSTIKRQKAASDTKKGALFTKLARAITVGTRDGGSDPATNVKLRLAIDQARANNMPKDNIERAIKRGTGELAGDSIEEVVYEGFAPGGSALVIMALTDNRNRTVSDVKFILAKHGGTLSGPGSVLWMFDRRGVVRVSSPSQGGIDELQLIDFGVDDIVFDGDELVLLTTPEKLSDLRQKLHGSGWTVISDESEQWPQNAVSFPEGREGERFAALVAALEEHDDVTHVATNAVL